MSEMSKEKEMEQDKEVRQELDLDELDQVAGGASLRNVKKIQTTDISDNTRSKI